MKKIYITETRNENGKFYRQGDWGIERPDDWDSGRGNWTTIVPPAECLSEIDPIPCDWNEETQSWNIDEKAKWDAIRKQRDKLLAACDWTQVPDATVDQEAWATYRQTLRNIPQTYDTPDDIIWPDPPE